MAARNLTNQPVVQQRQPYARRKQSGFIAVPKPDNSADARNDTRTSPEHLTRTNRPDRRFLENRSLPPNEEAVNPDYTPAGRGEVIEGIHFTIDGKVDRRFKDERMLSDQEIAELELLYLERKAGRPSR